MSTVTTTSPGHSVDEVRCYLGRPAFYVDRTLCLEDAPVYYDPKVPNYAEPCRLVHYMGSFDWCWPDFIFCADRVLPPITKPMRAKLVKMSTDRYAFHAQVPNTVESRLLIEGLVALQHRNGRDCQPTGADLTETGWAAIGMHLVDCDGEAHGNPHIDNCSCCVPRWGKVAIPIAYSTLSAYRSRDFDQLDLDQ